MAWKKIIGGAVLFAAVTVVSGCGGSSDLAAKEAEAALQHQLIEEAAQAHQLSKLQIGFTHSCVQDLTASNLLFKGTAERIPVCACVAKALGEKRLAWTPKDYALQADLLVAVAEGSRSSNRNALVGKVSVVAAEHRVTMSKAMKAASDMAAPVKVCRTTMAS